MPEENGRLKPEDEKRIRSNFVLLKGEIDGKDFVDFLYQEHVFDGDDKEMMNACKIRSERADLLLTSLLKSGPGKSYKCFFQILNEKYPTLASILERTPTDDCSSRSYYSWFDSVDEVKKRHKITQADTCKLFECFDDNWPNIFHQLGFSSGEIEQEYIKHQHDSRAEMMSLLMKGNRQRVTVVQDDRDFTLEEVVEALKRVEDTAVCFIKWDAVKQFVNKI
ncbi:unnamed protein product [Lymnaea stagnalis]|uniref:CARD domain-containing protein n=1 Tax=Lymnaea stagnalis TaxID=6523 RepID=A0AAV2H455_LYMST